MVDVSLIFGASLFLACNTFNLTISKRERVRSFRRKLVDEASSTLRKMGFYILTLDDEDEAVRVQTESFMGTEKVQGELGSRWCYGKNISLDEPFLYELYRIGMLCCFRGTVMNGGVAIGLRNNDGTLGAVCLTEPLIGEDGERGVGGEEFPGSDIGISWSPPSWPPPGVPEEAMKLHYLRADWFWGGKKSLLKRLHGQFAPGPHWYVCILAVHPSCQGKGMARKLLSAVSTLADKDGVPCFLDTCGERNRQIYERCGYEVAGGRGFELNVPGDPDPMSDPTKDFGIIRHYGLIKPPQTNVDSQINSPGLDSLSVNPDLTLAVDSQRDEAGADLKLHHSQMETLNLSLTSTPSV